MSGQKIAGIQLAKSEVSTERLKQIARNKLAALAVQTYFAGDFLRGRFIIDVARFPRPKQIELEKHQHFVVDGHDRFWFVQPSPLRFLGAIPFFQARTQGDIHRLLEQRWLGLIQHSKHFYGHARAYFPSATIDFSTWSVEVALTDQFGSIGLQIVMQGQRMWIQVKTVDGAPFQSDDAAMALPEDPAHFSDRSLAPLLARVRRKQGRHVQDPEAMELDLGPPSQDLELPDTEEAALSLDLELDLSDDLPPQSPPDLGLSEAVPPKLDPQHLVELSARPPRLKTTALLAEMSVGDRVLEVKLENANCGGVFASIPMSEAPEIGEEVKLSGFGPFIVSARVAHRRSGGEASLFKTEEGIGLAFLERSSADLAPAQDGAAALVLVDDPALLGQVMTAARATLKIVAPELVTAALVLRVMNIGLVVTTLSFQGHAVDQIAAALGMERSSIPGLLVGGPPPPSIAPFFSQAAPGELDQTIVRLLAGDR